MSEPLRVSDALFRGPRPTDMTELQAAGIKTIISLEYGFFEWFHGELYAEDDQAREAGISIAHYRMSDFSAPTRAEVEACLMTIRGASANGPVYIHCKKGKDRTGFVCAAYRVREQGWNVDAAVAEWKTLGFNHWFYFWWESAFRKMMRDWK